MNKALPFIGLFGCTAFFSCQQAPTTAPTPPPQVNLYTVATQQVLYYDKYPSTTNALQQVNLLAQVPGYITAILAPDGSQVHKGQVLFEIDKRLYQQAVDQAEANLKVQQGNLVQAQQDADRYSYLNSYHAVAQQLYDHAVITLENAKNQVKASEEELKTAQTNLQYAVITAPFDGTIGFSQVRLGNYVTSGGTILNTISTNDPMAVDFVVNEKQLPAFEKIKNGEHAKMIDSLFTILLPDNSVYPYQGKISVIDRAVDPQTGSITLRLVFPNPKNDLKVGMSCIVRVHNQETTPQMVIPGRAVVEQMGEYFVFVAKDTVLLQSDSAKAAGAGAAASTQSHTDTGKSKGADSANIPRLRAFQKKIQLGQTIGANVIVMGGLRPGEKIVVDGVQAIHDGSVISAAPRKPGQGKGGGAPGAPGKTDSTSSKDAKQGS